MGGFARLARRGEGLGTGAGVVFGGRRGESGRVRAGVVCPIVKDQGGQAANGYRGIAGNRRLGAPLSLPTSCNRGAGHVARLTYAPAARVLRLALVGWAAAGRGLGA